MEGLWSNELPARASVSFDVKSWFGGFKSFLGDALFPFSFLFSVSWALLIIHSLMQTFLPHQLLTHGSLCHDCLQNTNVCEAHVKEEVVKMSYNQK